MRNLCVVIGKADCGKSTGRENSNPNKAVGQISPKKCGNHDRNRDKQAAHGWGARFLLMGLWPFLANVLPNLKFTQAIDDQRTNNQTREKSGEAGKSRAKGQITKNTERRKIMIELEIEQPVEQFASVLKYYFCAICARLFQLSSARSSFTPRDAFNKTTSPGRVSRASHSPASSGVSTNSACMPFRRAASTIGWAKPRTPNKKSIFFSAMCSPQAQCISSAAAPSSNISPATTTRRLAGIAANASTMEFKAFGLEL